MFKASTPYRDSNGTAMPKAPRIHRDSNGVARSKGTGKMSVSLPSFNLFLLLISLSAGRKPKRLLQDITPSTTSSGAQTTPGSLLEKQARTNILLERIIDLLGRSTPPQPVPQQREATIASAITRMPDLEPTVPGTSMFPGEKDLFPENSRLFLATSWTGI